jgi:hypothetical protein
MIRIAKLAALAHVVTALVGGSASAEPVYCSVWDGITTCAGSRRLRRP